MGESDHELIRLMTNVGSLVISNDDDCRIDGQKIKDDTVTVDVNHIGSFNNESPTVQYCTISIANHNGGLPR